MFHAFFFLSLSLIFRLFCYFFCCCCRSCFETKTYTRTHAINYLIQIDFALKRDAWKSEFTGISIPTISSPTEKKITRTFLHKSLSKKHFHFGHLLNTNSHISRQFQSIDPCCYTKRWKIETCLSTLLFRWIFASSLVFVSSNIRESFFQKQLFLHRSMKNFFLK